MIKSFKRIVSMILVFVTLFLTTIHSYAWRGEEYISDIRIIYASSFSNAKGKVIDSGLTDYKVMSTNLNENTGKGGVFLAYKTTTNIDDAITDIAVMQMNGGYNEGNYQQMIKESYNEYLRLGDNYLVAIDYFNEAYDAGNYLTEIAYRQLNFYNVVTEGIDIIPAFEGEHIGDIFYGGIDSADLATIFMEGNSYALDNIRSLIAMGVSYNEDGMTYLEKVSDEVEKLDSDPKRYDNEDYGELAVIISPTITVFRNMFKEFEAHEGDLDYTDEEITEKELYYAEYKLMTEMAKATNYLDGKTFYQFCIEYEINNDDYSNLYPLVAALNEGQEAMTRVAHYYDVVRYSMSLNSTEEIDAQLDEMEEIYSQNPFNVYAGVDRTIFRDTFALTSDAYRADAFTESGLSSALYNGKMSGLNIAATVVGSIGAAYFACGLGKFGYSLWTAKKAYDAYQVQYNSILKEFVGGSGVVMTDMYNDMSVSRALEDMCVMCSSYRGDGYSMDYISSWTLTDQYAYLEKYCNYDSFGSGGTKYVEAFNNLKSQFEIYQTDSANSTIFLSAKDNAARATQNVSSSATFLKGSFVIGGIMMLISSIKLGIDIYNYYHPEYSDIPTAMVDLINTPDGDRYIKYDVVYELVPQSDGTLIAGDINAFSAERWNALYYTKSYEAGKPLLANDFVVSHKNNVPAENYAPVHRFGEVVCYNLNKYNFDDDYSIYLSVKQSNNQKSAVADVPEIIGSVFSAGYLVLAGGVGIAVGVGGTIGVIKILNKKKKEETTNEENV